MPVESQSEAIAFLSRPESYGPGISTVERVDTHAAIVFLAGDRAYKLRRAVKYSYLDYSTVALRRRFSKAELALNRRTAPDLYLTVRALTRNGAGAIAFDGAGPPVDYVVEMRRFDQNDLFDRMAERGALNVPLMVDVAEEVARFHAGAPPVFDMGGSEGIGAVLQSNAENLSITASGIFDPTAVGAVNELSRAALCRLGALLDRRRHSGRVRHCHGDLHLRNICLFGGRPTLFDCIEFSRSLACIDLLYDLAFLLMDLSHRGLDGLANAVLNRYLDVSDESPDGLAVLPLFLSVRATIRAHVDASAAARQSGGTEVELVDRARSYLAMAQSLLRQAPLVLVAVGGLSGTGKSTLAYGLAPMLGVRPGARVLRSDVIRKRLMNVPLTTPLPESAYGREVTAQVYETLRRDAVATLAAGRAVIADAVFADSSEREAVAAAARAAGVPFRGFWLEAPAAMLAGRILARRNDASDATPAVLRRQLEVDLGKLDWIRLDAAADPQSCLSEAGMHLRGAGLICGRP